MLVSYNECILVGSYDKWLHPVSVYIFDIKLDYNCTGALLNQLTEMFVIGCLLPNKLIQKFYYEYLI